MLSGGNSNWVSEPGEVAEKRREFADGRKYVSYNKATLRPLVSPPSVCSITALFPPVRSNLGSVIGV
jgi:hypothetical protein